MYEALANERVRIRGAKPSTARMEARQRGRSSKLKIGKADERTARPECVCKIYVDKLYDSGSADNSKQNRALLFYGSLFNIVLGFGVFEALNKYEGCKPPFLPDPPRLVVASRVVYYRKT